MAVNQGNPHTQNGWREGHQARVIIPLEENVQLGVGDRDSQQIDFSACSKGGKKENGWSKRRDLAIDNCLRLKRE